MLRIFFYTIIFSLVLPKLPNEVRWVRESKEYDLLCKNIYRDAYDKIKSQVKNTTDIDVQEIDYALFLERLKDDNSLSIEKIECARKECIATSKEEEYFHIKMRSLSNTFINRLKRNSIKYTFNSKLNIAEDYSQKYAIVIDIDETILDNSNYQVFLHDNDQTFNQSSWSKWVQKEEATLVPGSKKFLKKIRKLGIRVILISNRMHSNLDPTINNFKTLKIYSKEDIFLLRKDKEDRKTVRRKEIFDQAGRMSGYPEFKVIGYLGDAYGDFPKNSDEDSWGTTNFVFPNPMYGKW